MKPVKGKQSKTNQKRELRISTAGQKFEVRNNSDGSRSISGYAATFGDLSQNLGGFREKIQPGAFSRSLKDRPDVMALYGHDVNQIIGRVSSGTLQITEDSVGLRFICNLPDTSTARDLIALIERGDLSNMSFGFSVIEDDWQEVNGQIIRTLIEVVLYEISVVGSPAYTSTSVNLRSAPKALRGKLKRTDDDDSDCDPDVDDDCEDEDRCSCDCDECEDGNCADCTGSDCDDDNCDGCPMQTRTAHLALLTRRLR